MAGIICENLDTAVHLSHLRGRLPDFSMDEALDEFF